MIRWTIRLSVCILVAPPLALTAKAQQPSTTPAQASVELVLPADVSLQDQQKIREIMNRDGFFPNIQIGGQVAVPGVSIGVGISVRSANMPTARGVTQSIVVEPGPFANKSVPQVVRDQFICPAACDIAAATAGAACSGISVGAGVAACLAAAAAGRDYCRSRC